jgi:phosphoribosylformimino-5-aminoimidazole carboxamide ribotide isomerase
MMGQVLVIPAIDILNGKVVRTEHGLESKAKVYSEDPIETAQNFSEYGASMIHIVDLDSAIHRDSKKNEKVIEKILARFGSKTKIQLAGGIRSKEAAERFINLGASRIVIGSIAYSDPKLSKSLLLSLGTDRVVLAIDYGESGRVRTNGWLEQQREYVLDALRRNYIAGFRQFLLTSITQDGTLKGPDFRTLEQSRAIVSGNNLGTEEVRLIASGGITSKNDLSRLAEFQIDEAVVGRAFFEGKLSLSEVISLYNK